MKKRKMWGKRESFKFWQPIPLVTGFLGKLGMECNFLDPAVVDFVKLLVSLGDNYVF